MKYIGRILIYLAIFMATASISSVIAMRFVPITITPIKLEKLFENYSKKGLHIHSNWVPLSKISTVMQQSVVATEDNNFLSHRGFDIEAIRLAVQENKKGKRVRGASTISQQTAKNLFCLSSRTWFRKGVESYFTVLMETLWSKRRIMEVYLNIIETHPNIYGVEATARHFYNKSASHLNGHEAAMIATVLPSPARMNIAAPSNYMVRRSNRVRGLIGKIPPLDYDNPHKKEVKRERKR